MTDKKDETGKGPAKFGDGPRRPYATLDLQATEVGGISTPGAGASGARPGGEGSALPPPGDKGGTGRAAFAEQLAGVRRWSRSVAGSNTFLSHVAAGVAGAVLTLLAGALFGFFSGDGNGNRLAAAGIDTRLAALEQTVHQQSTPSREVAAKLAQAESRLKGLENQAPAVTSLSDAQAKLAENIKALEARASSPEYVERLAKVETALAALSTGDSSQQEAALAEKLTELEKQVGRAVEASKSVAAGAGSDVAVIKTEMKRFGQRLDDLRSETDQRLKATAKAGHVSELAGKLAAFEQDLQRFLKGEGERTSNAARVLLTLEIATLKRTMDRGERYSTELDAVRKLAAGTLNLAPLARYSQEGAPTLAGLTRDFRPVADAAIDAEAEPADASVLDRLMSGARSIVRVRKAGHSADDTSTEAVIGRMEAALKEGRLGEVLAQGGKLPPQAALAAEDWLKKVEARHAVDRSLAEIETALKTSLAGQPPLAAEPKR